MNTLLKNNDEAYRTAARIFYAAEQLEVDNHAIVSRSEEGAWIAAWVWVSKKDINQ